MKEAASKRFLRALRVSVVISTCVGQTLKVFSECHTASFQWRQTKEGASLPGKPLGFAAGAILRKEQHNAQTQSISRLDLSGWRH